MTDVRPSPAIPETKPVRSRELVVTVLAWLLVAGVASVLRVITSTLEGHSATLATATSDVGLIALWALATPFVLRSARWLPVRAPRVVAHAFVHLVLGTAFIVLTNILIRLPMLGELGVTALMASTALGLARYYPAAIISYGVLVAVGNRFFLSPLAEMANEERPPEAEPADGRLVIREWNRVHFIEPDDIEWIEADNNHVVVHTHARTYKGRERISDVEARLDGRRFLRVHRSALVHIAKIREVQPLMRGDQAVILHSGRVVRVARSRRRALGDALGVSL